VPSILRTRGAAIKPKKGHPVVRGGLRE